MQVRSVRTVHHQRQPAAPDEVLDIETDMMIGMGAPATVERVIKPLEIAVKTARALPALPAGEVLVYGLGMLDTDDTAALDTAGDAIENRRLQWMSRVARLWLGGRHGVGLGHAALSSTREVDANQTLMNLVIQVSENSVMPEQLSRKFGCQAVRIDRSQ